MGAPRPSLVITPSDDVAFVGHVTQLTADPEVAAWLDGRLRVPFERRIREQFPKATVRPRDELAQIRPDDPPTWYVSRGREMFRLRSTVVIGAPRDRVFGIYIDPATLDRWQGSSRVRVLEGSPQVLGNAWEAEFEVLRIRLAGIFRVTEVDSPTRVRVEASGPLRSRLWYVARFQDGEGGTIVDVHGDYELPFQVLERVPSRLAVEREIERFVAGSHARLKALIEDSGQAPI